MIALAFHLTQTKSTDFLTDILKEYFDDFTVVNANDAWYEMPRIKPDTIIIFQKIYTPQEIDSFGAKNVVFIPMYDACPHTEAFWLQYKKYKVFCFSHTLYTFLQGIGVDSFYAQYYPTEISKSVPAKKNDSAFFWQRSTRITWDVIKTLSQNISFEYFHFHMAHNITTQYTIPNHDDVQKYHITFSDWFDSQKEYINLVQSSSIFFAPRESEGIGHSFIQALCAGCCVVAPNLATMNEYITNGINGLLYDIENPQALDFSYIEDIQKNAISIAFQKRLEWEQTIPAIIAFFKKPLPHYKSQKHFLLIIRKRLRAEIRHIYTYFFYKKN